MNELKVFSNTEFGELGVMLSDGKEYFPATQCAKILGYANPRKAVIDHCKKDGVTNRDVIDSLGRTQQMKFISEGNLYRLIVSSKLPAAEKFERWVFDEVLPSIRQNGSYGKFNLEELITKTATAAVTEVMKQIAPIVVQNTSHVTVTAHELPKNKNSNKALYVERELFFLLNKANSNIVDITYCEDNGIEWIIVTMKNGYEYKISITGDSLMAIAKDVASFMLYR